MTETPGERKDTHAEEFDFHSELSELVEEGLIPIKIAEKLEKRLDEKQIKITKEQLYKITEKIKSIIDPHYKKPQPYTKIERKSDTPPSTNITQTSKQDMKTLNDNIDKLQTKIQIIEDGLTTGDLSHLTGYSSEHPYEKNTPELSIQDTSSSNYEATNEFQVNPLISLPTYPEGIVVMMKWLQYLVDKSGQSNLPEVLDYYVDIDWLSEDVKIQLLDYSSGITKGKNQGSNENIGELSSEDHIHSFLFIQKLKGKKIDKHFVDRINGEISRWTKRIS